MSRNEDSDETIAFLFGDMGTAIPYNTFFLTQEESIATMKWILRDIEALGDKPAFISHIGDINYARGYSWFWDHIFFTQIEPVASKVAYHVCIGNHEYYWPSQTWRPEWSVGIYGKDRGGECGVPFSCRFRIPGNTTKRGAFRPRFFGPLGTFTTHFIWGQYILYTCQLRPISFI